MLRRTSDQGLEAECTPEELDQERFGDLKATVLAVQDVEAIEPAAQAQLRPPPGSGRMYHDTGCTDRSIRSSISTISSTISAIG